MKVKARADGLAAWLCGPRSEQNKKEGPGESEGGLSQKPLHDLTGLYLGGRDREKKRQGELGIDSRDVARKASDEDRAHAALTDFGPWCSNGTDVQLGPG